MQKPVQKSHSNSIQKVQVKNEEVKKTWHKGDGVSGAKQHIIYDILKRWWYALPQWPPVNFDYAPLLKENNLRLVDFALWKLEPNFDKDGMKKAYMMQGFEGIFKDFNVNL